MTAESLQTATETTPADELQVAAPLTPAQENLRSILIAQGRAAEDVDYATIEQLMDEDADAFGARVADQIGGADLSEDREERESEHDAAMAAGARVTDWKGKLAGMSFEERVEATLESMGRRPANREVMSDLLQYCEVERGLDEAEEWLTHHRNYEKLRQSPHQYIFFMQRTGAIEQLEFDSDGVLITDEMRDELRELGAPEEEIEDMEAAWHVRTTDVGREALRRSNPRVKIKKLLAQKVSREATYNKVIAFCEQPRSMEEIARFLQGDPGLEINAQGIMQCQPSAYVSHLEEAGALTWEKRRGWTLTKEGMALLEKIK